MIVPWQSDPLCATHTFSLWCLLLIRNIHSVVTMLASDDQSVKVSSIHGAATWVEDTSSERSESSTRLNGLSPDSRDLHLEGGRRRALLEVGVRLVGGSSSMEGRVEVLGLNLETLSTTWGTVCDDGWDLSDANVVCKQLGWYGASSAPCCASFGQGSLPIIMDDVACSGSESDIRTCPYNPIDNCAHTEDAGVVCAGYPPPPTSVGATYTFQDLSISALDTSSSQTDFSSDFTSTLASAAGVPTDYVTIENIVPGSTAITSFIMWTVTELASGSSPDALISTAQNSPGNLFSHSPLLGSLNVTVSNIMSSGAISMATASFPSPPPISPPPPPGCGLDPCFPGVPCTEDAITAAFICHDCPDGYGGDGVDCADVDECAELPAPCDPLTSCANTAGSYECGPCPQGYIGEGHTSCADLDECAVGGYCVPMVTCNNTVGSYACGPCPAGTKGSGAVACLDEDECIFDNGGCDFLTECVNTLGGRDCTPCPEGYAGTGEGRCADEDECAEGNGGCSTAPLVACVNTAPGNSCGACPAGYLGDGRGAAGCRRSSSCAEENGGCDPLSSCVENAEAGGVECGACPAGFIGTGATSCMDADRCGGSPCFAGVECVDLAPPAAGYVCGDCPEGYVGNGISCEPDLCTTGEACSWMAECDTTPGGGYSCGLCPQGTVGDGKGPDGCMDVDECAVGRGGCDALVDCVNVVGSYYCTSCPDGYRSAGFQPRCLLQQSCSSDNGGCDELVECTEPEPGLAVCGECPEGYKGGHGCTDQDGCQGATCYEGVTCLDVPAPGTGFQCGSCPIGFTGDGTNCTQNVCFQLNGGCDPRVGCRNDATAPSGRVCGSCPAGLTDLYLDGTVCEDTDSCHTDPCFPGVPCADVLAPGVGRTCGSCPVGYVGDGAQCADIDECATDNGGCWYLDETHNTECVNLVVSGSEPQGMQCSACPAGFKGTGMTGCVPESVCSENHGGCWQGEGELSLLDVSCTDSASGAECGACPEGYAGTGDTLCYDEDGCAGAPCFPGVACHDVKAPAQGFLCDACPEGYKGDGVECTLCKLRVSIVDSTVVAGKEQRAGWHQGTRTLIVGQLEGLDSAECVNTQGTSFRWTGTASDGTVVPLDDDTNKVNTLKLSVPKSALKVREGYMFQLSSFLVGNPRVASEAMLEFYVESQDLVVALAGGEVVTGEGNAVVLDASASVDPDGEVGDIRFRWTCSRDDNLDYCRDAQGQLLPTRLNGPVLRTTLQGHPTVGMHFNYTFIVAATKGERTSKKETHVSIRSGAPPVPSITALLSKPNANAQLKLESAVAAVEPAEVELQWTVGGGAGYADLDLEGSLDCQGTNQEHLVLRAGSLTPGATYLFTLTATDSVGTSSAKVAVEVNTAPAGGQIMVSPLSGTALATEFSFMASDWVDSDQPLWYKYSYQVVGIGEEVMLAEFSPLPGPLHEVKQVVPEPGLEAWMFAVTAIVTVQDSLGATSSRYANLSVVEGAEVAVDGLLGSAEDLLLNGQSDSAQVYISGTTATLNRHAQNSTQRRRLLQADAEAADLKVQSQREGVLSLLHSSVSVVYPTATAVERVAQSAGLVAKVPEELSDASQASTMHLLDRLLEVTAGNTTTVPLSATAAGAMCDGLSSLVLAANSSNATALSARTSGVLDRLGAMGAALLRDAVPGESAKHTQSTSLALSVQRGDASKPLPALSVQGSATAVAFPESLPRHLLYVPTGCGNSTNSTAGWGGTGGGGAENCSSPTPQAQAAEASVRETLSVDVRLMTSATDPHAEPSRDDGDAAEAHPVGSDMTTIELLDSSGVAMNVAGLAEGINFTLAMPSAAAHPHAAKGGVLRCTFWDTALQSYSTEGCTALPNPAPPAAQLYWRHQGNPLEGGLRGAWGVGNASLMEHCVETFAAKHPEYLGTDEGYRKYMTNESSGGECALVDPENAWGCHWVWQQQIFDGAGCQLAAATACLCRHLTDFKAEVDTDPDTLAPPK
ncbi:hypothetical protein CYMTET_34118, partial [Cymbomonas tetramitiformis]